MEFEFDKGTKIVVAVALVGGLALGTVAGSFVGGGGEVPDITGASANSGEVTVTVKNDHHRDVGVLFWRDGGEEGTVEEGETREFTGPASGVIAFGEGTVMLDEAIAAMYPPAGKTVHITTVDGRSAVCIDD